MSLEQKLVVKSAPSQAGAFFSSPASRACARPGGERTFRHLIRFIAQSVFASGEGFVTTSGNSLLAPGEIELAAQNVHRLLS